MMGTLSQLRPAPIDATAMVRVATADSRVHYASLRLYDRHLAERAFQTPPALVVDCLERLRKASLTLGAVDCSGCVARAHVHAKHDVTNDVIAGAIA